MLLVLDTNILVSALLYGGPPGDLWTLAQREKVALATSAPLLRELTLVLARPKFAARVAATLASPQELARRYASLATLVLPTPLPRTVLADPADDAVLACATAARADAIVSGDEHLLSLGAFRGIPIVPVSEILSELDLSSPRLPSPP